VNELPIPTAAVRPPRAQRCAALGPRLLLGGALLLCAFARGQDPGPSRWIARRAAQLLQHNDPTVRGEAALVASATATDGPDLQLQAQLLTMARDPADEARHRATLALGQLGTPAAAQFLAARLGDLGTRGDADGPVLAYALGNLPAAVDSARTEVLNQFFQGSFRRQRDTMLGLLLGIDRDGTHRDQVVLQRLFADDANRDPEVRALLLHLLLPQAPADVRSLRRQLERAEPAERDSVLRWLAESPVRDPELLALVERIASRSDRADERARALAVLTRAGHLPALELAARALRSEHPVEIGQAMRSMLAIGGAQALRPLDERVRSETDPRRKLAMLTCFDAPPSAALTEQVAALAVDGSQPFALRTAAALLLERSAPERSGAVLRELFRIGTEPSALRSLALALQSRSDGPLAIDHLLDGATDLQAHPLHWLTLLQTGHPEAVRQVLQHLEARDASVTTLRTTLQTWRRAMVTSAPRWRAEAVPERLRELLVD
jgi:HEAT repeat protein